MKENIVIKIIEILKQAYPDAKCSLDFKTPFELVVAVMLSAQCTDERVNQTTPYLLSKALSQPLENTRIYSYSGRLRLYSKCMASQ